MRHESGESMDQKAGLTRRWRREVRLGAAGLFASRAVVVRTRRLPLLGPGNRLAAMAVGSQRRLISDVERVALFHVLARSVGVQQAVGAVKRSVRLVHPHPRGGLNRVGYSLLKQCYFQAIGDVSGEEGRSEKD